MRLGFDNISAITDLANPLHFCVVFSIALRHLTNGFYLLDLLEKNNYEPARVYQIDFNNMVVDIMRKSGEGGVRSLLILHLKR